MHSKKQTFFLRSFHGGLGDELQFSTLPESLSKMGHPVYLLKDSEEVHPFRNEEIKQFVWGENPFIKGEMHGKWNLGDTPEVGYHNTHNDFIKNWEASFGVKPLVNSLPHIYRQPLPMPVDGLIELSALSLKYNSPQVLHTANRLIWASGREFRQVLTEYQSARIEVPDVASMQVQSLNELFDAICSCNVFISLSSGAHSMAAAARRYNPHFKHYCILPAHAWKWTLDDCKFVYPGVIYVIEGSIGPHTEFLNGKRIDKA